MGMLLRSPLFACFLILFITSSCRRKGEDSIYLFPKGFQGNVLVIFERENGMAPVYEDGKRLYTIDTSGVLRTRFKPNYGISQSFYYWIDDEGKRIPLRYLLPLHMNGIPEGSNEVFVYNLETPKSYDTEKSKHRHAELFTVSSIKNLDSISNSKSSFMWDKLSE